MTDPVSIALITAIASLVSQIINGRITNRRIRDVKKHADQRIDKTEERVTKVEMRMNRQRGHFGPYYIAG